MSASASATDSWRSQLVICCPSCGDPFTATGDAAPVAIKCGHWFCAGCSHAITNVTTPKCTVCGSGIDDAVVVDAALAALVDASVKSPVESGTQLSLGKRATKKRGVAATSLCCSVHTSATAVGVSECDLTLQCAACFKAAKSAGVAAHALSDAAAAIRAGLAQKERNLVSSARKASAATCALENVRERIRERSAACVAKLDAEAAALKAAIDARVASTKAIIAAEVAARMKAIDAQLDAVDVTASQLRVGAELCAAVLAKPEAPLTELITDAQRIRCLRSLEVLQHWRYMGSRAAATMEIRSDSGHVLREVSLWATLQLAVNQTHSDVTYYFDSNLLVNAPNTFQVEAKDATGGRVRGLTSDDVQVDVESGSLHANASDSEATSSAVDSASCSTGLDDVSVAVEASATAEGVFDVTIVPKRLGIVTLSFAVDGVDIVQTEFRVRALPILACM